MRKKTVVISALVLGLALMFTACAARRPIQTPAQQGQDITGQYSNSRSNGAGITNPSYYGGYNNGMYGEYGNDYRNIGGSNNSSNFGLNNARTATTQAERLARSCESVPGVDNATCVISGNTCYVGVDTDGSAAGGNVAYGNANNSSTVKQQCAQKVKAANPQIKTVYVSTDANFFERLKRVSDGMGNGSMGNNFRTELSELVRGLTPERL
ncbi:MAG: YhcN/YlaJ family sporulation lipoprotein [Clostridiaceae bacterium]|nr:YhcN/YlaJ family sporulation lipoprotein [Clostridiaceae bacterium]